MTIPNTSLDNLAFNEIFEKIRSKIPTYSKSWTDFNYSDPGITFLDLFAWLAENKIYSLNHISKRNYLKFLKLIGFTPRKPTPTKIIISFENNTKLDAKKDWILNTTFDVTKGWTLKSNSAPHLIFQLNRTEHLIKAHLKQILQINLPDLHSYYSYTAEQRQAIERFMLIDLNLPETFDYQPFVEGKGVCFGFDIDESFIPDKNNQNNLDQKISFFISIKHYLGDKYPIGIHCHESFVDDPGLVTWQYLTHDVTPQYKWVEFNADDLEDDTLGFTKSGIISFKMPYKKEDKDDLSTKIQNLNENSTNKPSNTKLFWIRCLLKENVLYDNPPIIIDSIISNCVAATQGAKTQDEFPRQTPPIENQVIAKLGSISESVIGHPNQQLHLSDSPVINLENLAIIPTDEMPRYYAQEKQIWSLVDDFDDSQSTDQHYTLDYNNGIISFGDGKNGRIPQAYGRIVVNYTYGEPKSAVPLDTVFSLYDESDTCLYSEISTKNVLSIGNEQESLDDLKSRAKKELLIPNSALTLSDIEYVVKNTPDLRIARSAARISGENEIEIVIIPVSHSKKPLPTQSLLKSVCKHIDKHRPVTTLIKILSPKYVEISVNAVIRTSSALSEQQIIDALANFLIPVSQQPDYEGWPIGRPVYKSEILSVLEKISGVDCVESLTLHAKSDEQGLYRYSPPNIILHNSAFTVSGNHNITIKHKEMICRSSRKSTEPDHDFFEEDKPLCGNKS